MGKWTVAGWRGLLGRWEGVVSKGVFFYAWSARGFFYRAAR